MPSYKFIMYTLPVDISHTLQNGNISYSKDSSVSQLSVSFQNVNNELVGIKRILVAPNTKLELYFSMGNNEEISIGTFYIDRTSVGYPDGDISVTARNVIGKLLKEQTFDEDNSFTAATLQENLIAILSLAEVENFFVSDPQRNLKLTFKPEMNILNGIEEVISLIPGWQIRENTNGTIGVGAIIDGRFEQSSTYVFERDKTCWSYNAEYDDEQTFSKLCITCKEPANTLYAQLPPHKWWVSTKNKTKYLDVPDGTSLADMQTLANELSELIAISGKTETFAGVFTPQLIIGDIIELIETDGKHSIIGTVTSVKHTLGKGGFYTEFTVDSGGRKGKPLLRDFVEQISGNRGISGVVIS